MLVQMNETERLLLKRLLSRDPSAVREFYDAYAPMLLKFISRKIGDVQDVEEIAQDTLFAFLEGARDFTGSCKLSTYICSIANNKIVDFYRKRKLKKIVFSQLPVGFELLISQTAGPEEMFVNQFVKQKIAQVLSALQPHYRSVLTMKYVEGRSVSEISQKLKVSFKSAESILFRARRAFVSLYTQE